VKFKTPTMKLPAGVAVYRVDGNPLTESICRFTTAMEIEQLFNTFP
jgi:hypothetical protein